MNVLVINCGSSSLKYQLISSDTEEVLAKGLCERIGIDGSAITHQPEEMDKAIEKYFKECDEKGDPYTMSGLAIALGFYSRNSLLDYANMDDVNGEPYLCSIKKAKIKCEDYVEKGLLNGKCNATGAIFNLKNNYGWKDKTEQEIKAETDNKFEVEIKVI